MKKVTGIALIAAALGFSSEAAAQNKQPPSSPDGEEPKTLEECQKQLKDSKDNADTLRKERDECLNKPTQTGTPAPIKKPAPIKCVGEGIESDGAGGCKCTDPRYVAVVRKSFQEMACVTPWAIGHQLELDVEALKLRGGDVTDLQKKVEELWKRVDDLDAFKKLQEEINADVQRRLAALEAKNQEQDGRLDALEGLAQSPWTTGADVSCGGLFLPGTGGMGFCTLQWLNTVYFNKTTPVGLKLKAGAGRAFANEGIGGGAWLLDGGLGPTFNLYKRFVELSVLVTGKQLISDHGAGYQGVLNDPGIGFIVGGEAELNFNFAEYVNANIQGGLGGSQSNYFAGPADLRQDSGLGGWIGLGIGVHTEVVGF